MRIELINTGNELLLGTTLNTHGAWIGRELFSLGLRLSRQTTIGDGVVIEEALSEALPRAEVILITGGLGPTSDDLTREAVAAVLGVELIEDEAAVRSLQEFFRSIGRPMVEANRRQAQVPVGATVIPNPNGTAPGLYLPPRMGGAFQCGIFLLPGPPRELQPMFAAEVTPILRSLSRVRQERSLTELKFTSIGESDLAAQVTPILGEDELAEEVEVGYCARPGQVDLRLIGARAILEPLRVKILDILGEFLISDSEYELAEQLIEEARQTGLKLSTAESCTGGLIANRLTDVAGASEVFEFGWVTYANRAKQEQLRVGSEVLAEHGAVSEATVKAMVRGALAESGADLAVAVSGIAGPGGGTESKPVGSVWIAWARREGEVFTHFRRHARDRITFKQVVSQEALFGLLRMVRGRHPLPPGANSSGR